MVGGGAEPAQATSWNLSYVNAGTALACLALAKDETLASKCPRMPETYIYISPQYKVLSWFLHTSHSAHALLFVDRCGSSILPRITSFDEEVRLLQTATDCRLVL